MPKAIFYLLKGDYSPELVMIRHEGGQHGSRSEQKTFCGMAH